MKTPITSLDYTYQNKTKNLFVLELCFNFYHHVRKKVRNFEHPKPTMIWLHPSLVQSHNNSSNWHIRKPAILLHTFSFTRKLKNSKWQIYINRTQVQTHTCFVHYCYAFWIWRSWIYVSILCKVFLLQKAIFFYIPSLFASVCNLFWFSYSSSMAVPGAASTGSLFILSTKPYTDS